MVNNSKLWTHAVQRPNKTLRYPQFANLYSSPPPPQTEIPRWVLNYVSDPWLVVTLGPWNKGQKLANKLTYIWTETARHKGIWTVDFSLSVIISRWQKSKWAREQNYQDSDMDTQSKTVVILFWTSYRTQHWVIEHVVCSSVADPDPGSGAFLTPRSGIRNRFFPDLGSRISDPGSRIPDP